MPVLLMGRMMCAELMTGGSLADALRLPREFSVRRALEITVDTARGLAYLHSKKPNCIIHRDLKPGNLMISGSSYYDRYKLSRCASGNTIHWPSRTHTLCTAAASK